MKRILFLRSNDINPDSRVEKEVNTLIKNGYNVEILGWDRYSKYSVNQTIITLFSGEVKIYKLGIPASFGGGMRKNLLPLLQFQLKMYQWIEKNIDKYDVIHACDFDTALTAYLIAKRYNKKLVYDIFDYYVDSFTVPAILKNVIEKLDNKIISNADAVILCTENRKKQIKYAVPKKVYIVQNSPSSEAPINKSIVLERESRIKIAYVGILQDGRLIKEIAQFITNHNNDFELHIGGFGKYEEYIKELSKENSNIFFYGKLSYNQTLELENCCDIMTAIYDPGIRNHSFAAPNKFYEALMLGKPILMVKGTGMSDIVEKNNIGELINYDISSFNQGLSRLVKKRKQWSEISIKMKQMYANEFSWTRMEPVLLDCYKDL